MSLFLDSIGHLVLTFGLIPDQSRPSAGGS